MRERDTDILKCTQTEKRFGFSHEWRILTQSDTKKPSTGTTDTAASYLVSSATSTSVGAVIGAFECPAVGSSVFSSPFVELITCTGRYTHTHSSHANQSNDWHSYMKGLSANPGPNSDEK